MSIGEWLQRRNAGSRRVPPILLKLLLAWFLSGMVLAMAVPMMRARQLEFRGWMAWTVIFLAVALCAGPDIRGWLRRR